MVAEVAPGLGAKETLEAVRAAMQQDTSGPDPLRPGGPDEDLAAFGSDLGDIHEEPAAQADEPSSNQPALEPAAGESLPGGLPDHTCISRCHLQVSSRVLLVLMMCHWIYCQCKLR